MKQFEVSVTVTYYDTYIVEADSEEDAREFVNSAEFSVDDTIEVSRGEPSISVDWVRAHDA